MRKESICRGVEFWENEISNMKVNLEDFLVELKELPLHLIPYIADIYISVNKIIEDLEKIREVYCQ